MSPAEVARQAVVRQSRTALAGDLATAMLLVAGAAGALLVNGPAVGEFIGLLGLIAAAALLLLRFPRAADPEDAREGVYRAGRLTTRFGVQNGFGGLGRFQGLRMLAAGVVLVLWVRGQTDGGRLGLLCACAAVAGLVISIAAEPFLVRLLRLPTPYAVRLVGLPELPDRTRIAALVAPAGIAASVVAGACAVAEAPGWLLLVVAVAATVPIALAILQTRSRRRAAARIRTRLPRAVQDYRPEFVLYTAWPDDASHQLRMWLPYLVRTGRRFLIVTRDELSAEGIAPHTDVPVVCCRSVADLDLIMTDTLRAAFYVNASSGNGALVRYHQLNHVFLGHGDSDKPTSYNPTHAMYDQIFTAGPAANRRYRDHGVLIDPGKFRVVGRPQVEVIRPIDPDRTVQRTSGARPVVLYAPTWRGHVTETALSSVDRAESIVEALLSRDAEVIFRPHPFSYDDAEHVAVISRVKAALAEDARRTGREHRYGAAAETELDAFGCMNAADVMISDVSSVVSDFLYSGKPFAMIAPPAVPPDAFVADYPIARAAFLVDHELRDLPVVLDDLLVPSGDRLVAARIHVRADYLGDFPTAGYADHFVQAVRAACDSPAPRFALVSESDDGSTVISRDTVRRNLDSLARTMISGVATVGALAAGLDGETLIGVAAAGLALLVAALTLPRRTGVDETPLDGPRMIMVLAAAAGAAGEPVSAAVVIATLLVVLGLGAEPVVRNAWSYPGVIAAALPELQVPGPARPRWLLPMVAALLGWLAWLPTIMTSGLVAGLLPVLVLGYLVAVIVGIVAARSRLAAAVGAESSVRVALEQRAPEFCVYFGSGIGAHYQVGMWLPYFQRLGRPFLIVTRALPMQTEIARLTAGTDIPVLFRPTLRSLEDVVVPSMRVAYYVNNAFRNTHLIERRELTHVWLNHGDSEKPACYNPVHAIYDRIFTAGQAGIDRYARHNVIIPAGKFTIVGRPQTESITAVRAAIGEIQRPTVLYAPTWQGPYADSRVYSLPVGLPIIEALLARGVRVIFRAHPFNYRFPAARRLIEAIGTRLQADRRQTGVEHLWGSAAETEMTVEDCFNASDAMICDVSAVISDYLASEKPFAVVAVGRTAEELVAEAPAAAAGYPIAEDLADLSDALTRLLRSDPKASERDRMRRYYLGDLPSERAADGFLKASADLFAGGGRQSAQVPV